MAQTVFDLGEPITSRLKLGLTPDGTTVTSVSVQRPDGTVISGLAVSAWGGTGGDEKTVQFYGTDDGTPSGTVANAAGDWLVVWKVVGTGASVSPKVYGVRPLPTAEPATLYSPFLYEIADYAPWLTLDQTMPGGDTFLTTFTGNTWPTDEQVNRLTRRVADPIAARWPALEARVQPLARTYIALQVAAQLVRAYSRNENDLSLSDRLMAQAAELWTTLTELADNASGTDDPTGTAQQPVWAFPVPAAWGDDYL